MSVAKTSFIATPFLAVCNVVIQLFQCMQSFIVLLYSSVQVVHSLVYTH